MVDATIPTVVFGETILPNEWGNKVVETMHNLDTGHKHDGSKSRYIETDQINPNNTELTSKGDINIAKSNPVLKFSNPSGQSVDICGWNNRLSIYLKDNIQDGFTIEKILGTAIFAVRPETIEAHKPFVVIDGQNQYIKLPSLTTAQRNSLSPLNGMLIYNFSNNRFEKYQDEWRSLGELDSAQVVGYAPITDAVYFAEGTNITLVQSGNTIIVSGQGMGGSLNSARVVGQPAITTDVYFKAGSNVTLTQTGNTITMASLGGGAGGGITWIKEDSGTITVGTSEVNIFNKLDNNERIAYINLTNIQDNDTFELRGYIKTSSGGTEQMFLQVPYINAQPSGKKMLYIPDLHCTEFGTRLCLIKTAGTNRSFEYYVKVNESVSIPEWVLDSSGSSTISTTEITLFEKSTELGVYGLINLTPMASGDQFRLRVYVKTSSAGTYKVLDPYDVTYSNVQSNPIISMGPLLNEWGIKVTMVKVSGTDRAFEWIFFRDR